MSFAAQGLWSSALLCFAIWPLQGAAVWPGEVCLIGWLLNSPGQCYIDTGVGVGARLTCVFVSAKKKIVTNQIPLKI